MNPTQKILWGEGQFIRPQHFQRQDAYHEWRLRQAMGILHPYTYGVNSLVVDSAALKSGQLRLLKLQLVLSDGEIFNAPEEDDLPEDVDLDAALQGQSSCVFVAACATLRLDAINAAQTREEADISSRYYHFEHEAVDQFTDASAGEVLSLKKSLRLLPEGAQMNNLLSMPLVRIYRNPKGGYAVDETYMPSSTSIDAAPGLPKLLSGLLDALKARIDTLYGLHREPTQNVVEFRSGDAASFWLLHTLNSAHAGLTHLSKHARLHPERLFEQLLMLAGALLTFSKKLGLSDLPVYDHANPAEGFVKLSQMIPELLDIILPDRFARIQLKRIKDSNLHQGHIDAAQVQPSSHLYLEVSASMPALELIDKVPKQFKLGMADDVHTAAACATPCIALTPASPTPQALPVRPGAVYFQVDLKSKFYERMLKSQSAHLYAPDSGFTDLHVELIALHS
jgi:type VI secretion system protein ImpJ